MTETKTNYKLGEIVFLITDSDQVSRMVTGILIRPIGVLYYLTSGTIETLHYEIEIASDKSFNV